MITMTSGCGRRPATGPTLSTDRYRDHVRSDSATPTAPDVDAHAAATAAAAHPEAGRSAGPRGRRSPRC